MAMVVLISACTPANDRTEPAPTAAAPSPEPGCAAQVRQDQLPVTGEMPMFLMANGGVLTQRSRSVGG